MNDCCNLPLPGADSCGPEADAVRRAAFDSLRTGSAPRASDLARTTGLAPASVRTVLTDLVDEGLATLTANDEADPVVDGMDGLTVRPTRHHLVLDGVALHTWCGFDTIGIPAALGADATVQTACPTCDEPIRLAVRGGVPARTTVVGWWPAPTDGPVNETFCPTASLFCNAAHLDAWRDTTQAAGEAVSVADLANRGRETWGLFTDSREAQR